MITCLIEGMKKYKDKKKNFDDIWKVKQEKDENPLLFLNRLTEAFQKYSSVDPNSVDGQVLLGILFTYQSTPYIKKEIQKKAMNQYLSLKELKDLAYVAFHRERMEEFMRAQRRRQQAREQAQLFSFGMRSTLQSQGDPRGTRRPKGKNWRPDSCFRCGESGHWRKNCPNR